MSTYAVVQDGLVVNAILWDGVQPFETEGDLVGIPEDIPAGPGWSFDGENWTPPEEPPVEEPVADPARESALQKLMSLGLTEEEALSLVRS